MINNNITFLPTKELKDLSDELLMPNGKLKLLSYKDYEKLEWNDFRYFCHKNARYGIPTVEIVDFISKRIDGRKCIEIGSGHGDLGYHLKIHMTDSYQQHEPSVRKLYEKSGQPIIHYPNDVEKIEALEAIKKYNPEVVIGSWVTPYSAVEVSYGSNPFGIKENDIFDLIDTYILIGNLDIHSGCPLLLNNPYLEIKDNFIISRAKNKENNRMWIFDKYF